MTTNIQQEGLLQVIPSDLHCKKYEFERFEGLLNFVKIWIENSTRMKSKHEVRKTSQITDPMKDIQKKVHIKHTLSNHTWRGHFSTLIENLILAITFS